MFGKDKRRMENLNDRVNNLERSAIRSRDYIICDKCGCLVPKDLATKKLSIEGKEEEVYIPGYNFGGPGTGGYAAACHFRTIHSLPTGVTPIEKEEICVEKWYCKVCAKSLKKIKKEK